MIAKGSNTQWQNKQQGADNRQKSKIHRKTRATTIEWIKKANKQQQHQQQQTIKLITSIDRNKYDTKQINSK